MTNRFFVSAETIKQDTFSISEASLVHQMAQGLRFKPGEELELLDNSGRIYSAQVKKIGKRTVSGKIIEKFYRPDTPKYRVNLCLSLLKKDNIEMVLQKATELGVTTFTPIITTRCVKFTKKIPDRWHKIIKEAAEQCGRTQLPKINVITDFKKAVSLFSPGFACWQNSKHTLSETMGKFGISRTVNVFIGPEGDFIDQEIEMAEHNKIEPVNLGSNILRAETAAIAAVAILNL